MRDGIEAHRGCRPASGGGLVFPAARVRLRARPRQPAGDFPDRVIGRRRLHAHHPSPRDVRLHVSGDSAGPNAHGGHRLRILLALEPADRGEDGAARDGRRRATGPLPVPGL